VEAEVRGEKPISYSKEPPKLEMLPEEVVAARGLLPVLVDGLFLRRWVDVLFPKY
jgi:hypothetical protein